MATGLTVMYVRTFVANGEKRETFRHIGAGFPAKDGDGVDAHLWEIPPFEDVHTQLESGVWVVEKRVRLIIKTRREKPADPDVSTRRGAAGFAGG